MSSFSSRNSYEWSRKDLVVSTFSNVRSKDGSSTRLASMAINNVTETNTPNACVPPKFEAIKIEKPKNKIIEV